MNVSLESRPNLMDELLSTPRSSDSSIIINNFDSSSDRNEQKENQSQTPNSLTNIQMDLSEIAKENVKEKIKNFCYPFNKEKIEELSTSLMKTYSQLQISQSEAFLSRMECDLRRRQERTKQIDKFVEEHKMRQSEKDKVRTFNHLITDINTKALAKEQLNYMKQIINKQIFTSDPSKANKDNQRTQPQWDDNINDPFNKYQEDKSKKIAKRKEEQRKMSNKRQKEEVSRKRHKIIKSAKKTHVTSSLNMNSTKPKRPASMKESLNYALGNIKSNNKSTLNPNSNPNHNHNESEMACSVSNVKRFNNTNSSFNGSFNQATSKTKKTNTSTKKQPKLSLSKSQNNLINDLQFSQKQIELYQMNISLNKQSDSSNRKLLDSFCYKEFKQSNLSQNRSLNSNKPKSNKSNGNNINISTSTPVKTKKVLKSNRNYTKSATSYKLIDYFFDQNSNEQSKKLQYNN